MEETKNFVMHYRKKTFNIYGIQPNNYSIICLYYHGKYGAIEAGCTEPKFPYYYYHPPERKNLRFPLMTNEDILNMFNCWGSKFDIDIYMMEGKEKCANHELLEGLEKDLQNIQEKNMESEMIRNNESEKVVDANVHDLSNSSIIYNSFPYSMYPSCSKIPHVLPPITEAFTSVAPSTNCLNSTLINNPMTNTNDISSISPDPTNERILSNIIASILNPTEDDVLDKICASIPDPRHELTPTQPDNFIIETSTIGSDDFDSENEDYSDFELSKSSASESDSEHPYEKIYQGKMWKSNGDGTVTLEGYDMFTSKNDCQMAIKDYAIQEGFDLKEIKNEGYRYTCKCMGEKCTWRVHASKLQDGVTWAIKAISGEHLDCEKVMTNPVANYKWIATKLFEDIRNNPSISVKAMCTTLMNKFGLEAKSWTVRRAKKHVLGILVGKEDDSYALLPAYAEMVKLTNPGSVSFISWDTRITENPPFQRMFISFKAMADGFLKGCRKLIGVYGTFLSGPYKGVMLIAMGLDGNNGSFPLAYAIVEKENKYNWVYFFQGLVHIIGPEKHEQWTFISDRQKGILSALDHVFPNVKRRICYVHLERNFRKLWPSPKLKTLLWSACYAYTEFEFNANMQQIKDISPDAFQWLMREPVEMWARHKFDQDCKSDDMTTNFVESFNGVLKDFRGKHVNVLLEDVRRKVTNWFVKRKMIAMEWKSTMCPEVYKKLKKAEIRGRSCGLLFAGGGEYDIIDDNTTYTVNLNKWHCDCNAWMISGIPCSHAMRAIKFMNKKLESFVHECYTTEKYRLAYESIIHPIKDYKMWPDFSYPRLGPPEITKKAGRRSSKRRRGPEENIRMKRSTVVKCCICKHFHHNKAGCTLQGHQLGQRKRRKGEEHQEGCSNSKVMP